MTPSDSHPSNDGPHPDAAHDDDERLPAIPGTAFVLHPEVRGEAKGSARGLRTPEAHLEEAVGLAAAIDLTVVVARSVRVNKAVPGTLLGGGAVAELTGEIHEKRPEIVVIDHDLSPIQQRNLERAWDVKVIDRTGLILEIFGERARTKEGMLQVDLAHLSYQRSRLVRSWTHLERQRGGAGFMGGPGERQIELDRRQIDDRIVRLKRDLEDVRRTRGLHRKSRERVPYPVVAFVGYTNAGKSTLFNRLTQSDVFAKDLLFATLDPTMRQIELGGGHKAIVSDTVGFVSDLPTQLIAAFRATLEEVDAADIIVHVRDAAHPDAEAQRQDVNAVLGSMGIDTESDPRLIEVLNKADLLEPEADGSPNAVLRAGSGANSRRTQPLAMSALTGEGVDTLLAAIRERLDQARTSLTLTVASSEGQVIAWLYQNGDVVERHDDGERISLTVRLSLQDRARFEKSFGDQVEIPG
ncbi:GTPase HflX [Fodinicurvata sp. EGI_FJ10296]|uniref:GTPase HflX n=1 Tax=Fodinicurvata sp. EGI_FJ10296 TaxID=3231908 RepID=UPI003451D481